MRKRFTELIYDAIQLDSNIHFLTADLGFKMWDKIEKDYPDSFTKLGSSEQLMLGMSVGLSYCNKIPVCYSISTFLLNRPFEWLRNFVNYENLNVKLVGSGRDYDYSHDGWTHWPCDDEEILKHYGGFQTQILNILKPFSEENKVKSENNNKLTGDEKNYSISYKGENYITKSVHAKEFYTGYKTWLQNKFFGGGLVHFIKSFLLISNIV